MATAPRSQSTSQPSLSLVQADAPGIGSQARWGLALSLVLMLAALLVLVAVEYALPSGYNARWWGINPLGARHWAKHLHFTPPDALSAAHWALVFRLALLGLWLGYAGLAWCARRGAAPTLRQTLLLTATISLALALYAPPLLATDAYAYAAYAREWVLFGQNPYFTLPYSFLAARQDPSSLFLAWNLPTVYGPVWTWLTVAVVGALPPALLSGDVLGMKLMEAAALALCAGSAGRIAEGLKPGRGRLVALLVGVNPLLLLEGPAAGHNDLLMMALTLTAAACFLERKFARAGLWLGLAAGVKLLPLALIPWLLLTILQTLPTWRGKARAAGRLLACAALPLVVAFAPFWHGWGTLGALHQRAQIGHSTLLWAGVAYAAATVWLMRRPQPAGWLTAWAAFCAVLMLTGMGFAFPWYIAWVWPVLLLRPGRAHAAASALVWPLALLWESLYATLTPLRVLLGH